MSILVSLILGLLFFAIVGSFTISRTDTKHKKLASIFDYIALLLAAIIFVSFIMSLSA